MATALIDIEGVGETYSETLLGAGISSVEGLLAAGATPKGREELAAKTGISEKVILRWVNHADMFRIKGIGGQYSSLLEAAGVDTVPELAQRNAVNLTAKMAEINAAKNQVRRLPTESQVTRWIAEAKTLPRMVKY